MTKEEYQKLRNESLNIMRELAESDIEQFVDDVDFHFCMLDGRWAIGDRIEDQRNEDEYEEDESGDKSGYNKEPASTYPQKAEIFNSMFDILSKFCDYDEDQFMADLASVFPKEGRWYMVDYDKKDPHTVRG